MESQTSFVAVMMLAAAVPASGQIPVTRTTERAVYFSGDVQLEDGSKPPEPVLIRRVCQGSTQGETWTDLKGRFSFKVQAGGNDTSSPDAGAATQDKDLGRPIGNSTYYSNPVTSSLKDCEVQALLTGFWAERITISFKNTLDDTRIGTIILHAMSKGQALTVSATSLAAPSKARNSYDKGLVAMREQHWDAATDEFTKAVKLYPQFAAAWFELGRLRQAHNDVAGAVEAFQEALKGDSKYVRPYEGLTAIAERQQKWAELEKYSHDWIQLAPDDFPVAYLYNAFANANLNKAEQAEQAARQGLKVDKERKIARLSYVLGLLLMRKHEYGEGAKCLRTYLELAPGAKDADAVRAELKRIEAAQ